MRSNFVGTTRPRLLALLLVLICCWGCSDPVEPEPPLGMITIDPRPGSLDAPWTITGPADFQRAGSGSSTLTGLAGGDYVVAWGEVAGWVTPDSVACMLVAGDSIDLVGVYLAAAGSAQGFVIIDPGTFTMGSVLDEPGRLDWEVPHPVTLTRPFLISMFEVTEAWWHDVMGGTPVEPQLPKSRVSWDMAVQFCNALSVRQGLTPAYTIHGANGHVTWNQEANGYRLPTEAEWEYACRAGSTTAFSGGPLAGSIYCSPIDPNLDATGWYCGNSNGFRQEVGHKLPNDWDLYDMHGNVAEWVWDGYRPDYENLPAVDPIHDVEPGDYRVLRGGAWFYRAGSCRAASRRSDVPTLIFPASGLRPVRTLF